MIPKKIKQNLFLISIVSILGVFAHHGLADNSKSQTDIKSDCNKIQKFSGLHREMIEEQSNKEKYLEISKLLKTNFILPYTTLDEGKDQFPSIDLEDRKSVV